MSEENNSDVTLLIAYPLTFINFRRESEMTRAPRESASNTFLPVIFLPFLTCSIVSAQELQYPLAIAAHGETVYLADLNLPGIWKSDGGKLSVYFQASKSFRTPLNRPRCVAVDSEGRLYAGDSSTREVYRFDDEGKPQPLTNSSIGIPMGIAVTTDGGLLVSDLELHRIMRVSLAADKKPTVEKYAEVPAPTGIALDGEGRLWVVSRGPSPLWRVGLDGKVEKVIAERAFEFPNAVAIGKDGTAYIADGYAKAIWKLPPEGKHVKWVSGDPLVNPVGLAWQDDKLLVVDPRANGVFQVDPEAKISAVDLGKTD